METSRQEALSNAYFIRSVLSKISDNFDAVQEKEKSIKAEEKKTFSIEKPMMPAEEPFAYKGISIDSFFEKYVEENSESELVVEYKENLQKLSNAKACVKEQEQETDAKLKTLVNALDEEKRKLNKFKRINLVTLVIDILLSATILLLWLLDKSITGISIVFAVISCLFAMNIIRKSKISGKIRFLKQEIAPLIQKKTEILASNDAQEVIRLSNRNIEIKRALFYEKKDEQKEIQKQAWEEMRSKRIQEYEGRVANWQNQKACFEIEKNKALEVLRVEIDTVNANTKELYNILKCDFKLFLDEQDWQHLDLLIYELETGRADTIKEALQQADLYIRHEEIKGMMATATNAICATIKESIGELSCSIGASLAGLRSEMSEMNQASRELASNLTARVDDLVNAQELSNALLKKANVSSQQLADDVHRMRLLRDEEYYRA